MTGPGVGLLAGGLITRSNGGDVTITGGASAADETQAYFFSALAMQLVRLRAIDRLPAFVLAFLRRSLDSDFPTSSDSLNLPAIP